MTINRSNLFLAALLFVQLLLLAISAITSTGTESRRVEPIMGELTAADVEGITIADDLNNVMTFARGAEGWVLPNADDFPLDSDKVDEMLGKLEGLDTRRLVATNPANFARLEVKADDFRRSIELESAAGGQALYLGGSGGVDTVYLRRADENEVYLGRGLNAWELSTQVSTWLDANYVNVPIDDVQSITVRNAQGTFTFLRAGEDWTYDALDAGAVFEDTRMPLVLRNAAGVRMLEPLGLAALDEYGLDEPAVLVDVRYRQLIEQEADESEVAAESEQSAVAPAYAEKTYTLTFGATMDDGDVVLKSSAAEYYVLVRDTVLNAFKDIAHADLIKQPEPESEGEPAFTPSE